jgi:prepilin-type N-terminal cleavage/methylation domain-containing protein
MDAAMIQQKKILRARTNAEAGFSLVEVMVSMAVLTIGLVSLLGVFGLAMATTQTSQEDMIAKQLANEAYESIITARNTTQIGWDDIQNVGSTNCPVTGDATCGIFLTGLQQIYSGGSDGIYGTADDATSAQRQTLHDPGPDGIFGTADDVYIPLTGYQRSIALSAVNATLRNVTITVQYATPQTRAQKTYILSSYISEFQ